MTEPAPHIVVLGGPAGVAAALAARTRGADVTVIERAHLGGTCVHGGCIPSAAFHSGRARHTGDRIGCPFRVAASILDEHVPTCAA